MKIFLGADHNGYELKNVISEHLIHAGYQVEDVGAYTLEPNDDYPKYAYALTARLVGGADDDLGILICASGQGMAIAANRVSGIRAALAWTEETAVHARRDDNANVLVLAPRYTVQEEALAAVDSWLATDFSKNPKYERRIEQIEQLYG
ncbi:MAG TPA: RpiB/LacA/LacB family sugar-phosphate isomerase [Candidatus Saccharimonadia bacterium]|nr:RpiB/LacA/LacB family sugar-phosphate isomerase [Candidatus Saccharimonadia bacterium]